MMFGYLTLFTALIISLSAAVYSILGLTAIFAAAFWPIVIMGGSLEFGKIITTLWLHKYWDRAEIQYKLYLCSAVAILMLLTSMGVFGFLSKAHSDQGLVSGDVSSKIAIYDEKIKISRDNIDANRKALTQMDAAVDQVMARSTTEGGADKAVQIRRSQGTERSRLLKEIDAEQKKITALNDEAAPIRAEVRKVDAEVGPIKYIAALIYGDNPDANILEKSVRWVIILIVIVFDPLALTLLLAATKALEWERGINVFAPKRKEPEYEADDGPLTDDQVNQIKETAAQDLPTGTVIDKEELFPESKNKTGLYEPDALSAYNDERLVSIFDKENLSKDYIETLNGDEERDLNNKKAMRVWKELNPDDTIKHQERLYQHGFIDQLPWEREDLHTSELVADNAPSGTAGEMRGFGTSFPEDPNKGDMFLRVDQLPSSLYKFNGNIWIEVDKALSDSHAYDDAYINHLIEKISTGEYDPELLSDAERSSIERQLKNNPRQA